MIWLFILNNLMMWMSKELLCCYMGSLNCLSKEHSMRIILWIKFWWWLSPLFRLLNIICRTSSVPRQWYDLFNKLFCKLSNTTTKESVRTIYTRNVLVTYVCSSLSCELFQQNYTRKNSRRTKLAALILRKKKVVVVVKHCQNPYCLPIIVDDLCKCYLFYISLL